MNNDDFTVLAVCKNNHEFIGTCAIIKNDENDFEIGYRIAEEFWGNGFGSELLQLLIKYCFEVRELESIVAFVEGKNIHSVHMLQKCGMNLINEFIDEDMGEKVQYYRLNREDIRNL
jgi:ribosomal-protein-alanine N-acetyltransferase